MAMVWQPIPPPAICPSSSIVERLCGQPEQKAAAREGSSSRVAGLPLPTVKRREELRFKTSVRTSAMRSGSSSPVGGKCDLPKIRGALAVAVENLSQLQLEEAPFFFHDQNRVEPFGEVAHELRLEGKRHRDLADAHLIGHLEIAQCLLQIVVGFTRAENADLAIALPAIDAIQTSEVARCFEAANIGFVLERQA